MKYVLISGTQGHVQTFVNKALQKGWRLHGTPFFVGLEGDAETMVAQALVKPDTMAPSSPVMKLADCVANLLERLYRKDNGCLGGLGGENLHRLWETAENIRDEIRALEREEP